MYKEVVLKKLIKLAILGTTGVGKDTCLTIIRDQFPNLNIKAIRLAEPLYQAQQAIYTLCGCDKDFWSQDGELLNFLGSHMRKINPNVLKEQFLKNLKNIPSDINLIICSDTRPLDIPFVKAEGFFLVHIFCDPEIALKRRKLRKDLSLGNSTHSTEQGLSDELFDARVENNGTFEEFQEKIVSLMKRLFV